MKKTSSVLLVLSALCLTSCGNPKEYNTAVDHLKQHLKDPTSVIISDASGYKDEERCAFRIVYNAKNSFGAYTGNDVVYVVVAESTYCSECSYYGSVATNWYSILAKSSDAQQLKINVSNK